MSTKVKLSGDYGLPQHTNNYCNNKTENKIYEFLLRKKWNEHVTQNERDFGICINNFTVDTW